MAGRRGEKQRTRRLRAAVAVLGACLLFEGGLRVVLGNFAQSRVLQRSSDPAVCLELRPSVDVTYTGWLLRVPATRMRTNRLGGRGAEVGPKVEGRLRIAAFGDSFTFGQGVEEDESWPSAMGAALRAAGTDVEVLNFGVPGHGTPQAVAHAERLAVEVDADLVLLAVFTNDLSPQDSYCGYGEGDSAIARRLQQSVYIARLLRIVVGPLLGGPARPQGAAPPEERFQEALAALDAKAGTSGFRAAAVLLSDRASYAAEPWCDGCTPPHDLLNPDGPVAIDMSSTWPVLVDHRDRYFLRGEEHLSAAGNRVLGEGVAEALTKRPKLLTPR